MLRKFNVTVFSFSSLGLTLYGMMQPSYYTKLLISSGGVYLLLRIIVAASLLTYVFFPQARTFVAKTFLATMGTALLGFGLVTFVSPTFLGNLSTYIPIMDTLLFIVGGILALLMTLELPAHRSALIDKQLVYLATQMSTQKSKIQQSAAHIQL